MCTIKIFNEILSDNATQNRQTYSYLLNKEIQNTYIFKWFLCFLNMWC